MSMYVEVLSGAMDRWDSELSGDALVGYVRSCRAALPARDPGAGVGSESSLVAEIATERLGGRLVLALELRGVNGGLGAARDLELAEQAGDVVLHCVLREEHRLGDLLVRPAFRDEIQDPRLLGREGRDRRINLRRVGNPVDHPRHSPR